jgi:transcription antitermination factor NusG
MSQYARRDILDQPALYPDDLLDGSATEPSDRRWLVLYTKVHQEKAISRQLHGRGVPYYLPLVEKTSQRRGRRFVSMVPVFAGYVFLYGNEQERVWSLTTNRVSRILSVPDQEGLAHDLRRLQRLIASEAPLTVEKRLVRGDHVRVHYGPLAGLEGIVLRRDGTSRLLIAVNFLQQGASVEIEDYLLEPLSPPCLDERYKAKFALQRSVAI